MAQFRFDGRTAIVTGAGGNPGLGRAHALLLAERGANVLVNDIGTLPSHLGYADVASAEAVAVEIRERGGSAVFDSHSVASEAGATAIVDTALKAFGQIDIVINNAAVCIVASIDAVSAEDFRRHIDVNLLGTAWLCKAAWPHMRDKGYGRIVNIASASMQGGEWQVGYAASKGGVFSLTRALAAEGAEFGIKANTVNPGAYTRMVSAQQEPISPWSQHARARLPAEMVSPVVALLAHEDCPVSGECIQAMGGEIKRTYLAQTEGLKLPSIDIETLASKWPEVMRGADRSILGHDNFKARDWHIRPYHPS